MWARQIRDGRDAAAATAALTTSQIFTSAFKLIDNNAQRLNMNLLNFPLDFRRQEKKPIDLIFVIALAKCLALLHTI